MEVALVREHVRGRDPDPLVDITTADAVTQGPTALAHVLAPTAGALRPGGTRPHPFSPTSSPRPVTMAIVTPSLLGAIATVGDPVTKGSVLGHGPARLSRWTGSGKERGNGRETENAVRLTLLQKNTNTKEVVTEETGGRGRGLAPMTGKERESVATRANTTAVVDTQDTVVIGAETPTHTNTHTHSYQTGPGSDH